MIFHKEFLFKSNYTLDNVKSKLIGLKKISREGWNFEVSISENTYVLRPNFFNDSIRFSPEFVVNIDEIEEQFLIKVISRVSFNYKLLFLFSLIVNIPIIGYSFYIGNVFYSWGLIITMIITFLMIYIEYIQQTKRVENILIVRLELKKIIQS